MTRAFTIVVVCLLTGLMATENASAQIFRGRSANSGCGCQNQNYQSGYTGTNAAAYFRPTYAMSQQMQQLQMQQLQMAQQQGTMQLVYDSRSGRMYYVPTNQRGAGQNPAGQSTIAANGQQQRPNIATSEATNAGSSSNDAADAIFSSLNQETTNTIRPATFNAPVSESQAPLELQTVPETQPALELPGLSLEAPATEQAPPADTGGSQSVLDFGN